jgi:lysophospholipase
MLQTDPSSKKLFVVSPKVEEKTSDAPESDTFELDANRSKLTNVETMDLQLSLAEKHERYIIFEEEPRVLIIYCSGCFGCYRVGHGYISKPGYLDEELRSYTTLCDQAYTKSKDASDHWIYSPLSVFNKRIRYKTRELTPLKPSSDMDVGSMIEIGKIIKEEYYNYEAFIILHGSDTIAYTAPVLSFMLENLRKTVIITACLMPLCESRNDANNNLVAALTIAGHYWIPEVLVLFNNYVYRGNRIIKDGASTLESIKSPNFGPLVKIGSYINIKWNTILYNKTKEPFNVSISLERNLTTITIFPFMTVETFNSAFGENVKGIFIHTTD